MQLRGGALRGKLRRQSTCDRKVLAILAATHVATVIKPFTTRRSSEIVSAPRGYAFDTGFVVHCHIERAYSIERSGAEVEIVDLDTLVQRLGGESGVSR